VTNTFGKRANAKAKGDSDSLAAGQRIDALLHQVRQAGVLESSTVQDADGHIPVADVGDLDWWSMEGPRVCRTVSISDARISVASGTCADAATGTAAKSMINMVGRTFFLVTPQFLVRCLLIVAMLVGATESGDLRRR